ncbi:MAG: DsbA family protein [Alphaproteobacteria bacterium]
MRVVSAAAFLAGAVLALGGAVGAGWLTDRSASEEPRLTAAEVQTIVRTYLEDRPEAVIDAIRAYQARQEKREADERGRAVSLLWDSIAHAPGDPVLGNPDGDVTLVEFFDYRCGYCKRVLPDMLGLVAADPKLRIVMKEFPILGPDSVLAARAALAADRQGRYAEVHEILMAAPGRLDEERVFALIEAAGLDMERLRADMGHPEIETALRRNMELAEALGIQGTPAFVTREEIVPGAVGGPALREMIERARAGAS